jgi:replicative DNA helicase
MSTRADAERLPPHDVEAERAVIGATLLASDRVLPLVAALDIDDFFLPAYREVMAAARALVERRMPVDILALGDELRARGVIERFPGGWSAWAIAAADSVPTVANVGHYARIVAEKSALRKTLALMVEVTSLVYGHQPHDTVISALREGAAKLGVLGHQGGPELVGGLLSDALKVIEGRMTGTVPTAIPSSVQALNDITGGYFPARLYLVAGRPGDGKTSFLRSEVVSFARAGWEVCMFSRETPNQESIECALSLRSGISAHKITSGRLTLAEYKKISAAAGGLYESRLWLDDRSSTIEKIVAEARKWHALNVVGRKGGTGLGLMALDYLQITKIAKARSGANREQVVAEMSGALKQLAMELKIPIVVLSQLSRETEKRGGRPILSDLRESGALEQDADVVIFVYRDLPPEDKRARREPGPAELIVGKHRGGPTGIADAYFDTRIMLWRDRDGYVPPARDGGDDGGAP